MNEWLEKLKVGDKVFVESGSCRTLTTVQRITPTGRIVVNNTQFIDGVNRSNMWNIMTLEEATEEKIQKYNKRVFIHKVYVELLKISKTMNYEQAKQVNEMLNLGVKEND